MELELQKVQPWLRKLPRVFLLRTRERSTTLRVITITSTCLVVKAKEPSVCIMTVRSHSLNSFSSFHCCINLCERGVKWKGKECEYLSWSLEYLE